MGINQTHTTNQKTMYKVQLVFRTGQISYGNSRGEWVVTKEFNDKRHCDNFINYINRTKGYMLDEIFEL
jgi:hypothetical protein